VAKGVDVGNLRKPVNASRLILVARSVCAENVLMSQSVRSKTSRKVAPKSKPKRSKEPDKVRRQEPRSDRRIKEVEVPRQDAELVVYEQAIALFNKGRFQAAKAAFAELAGARNRDLAHSAELRIRMCDQRLAPARSGEIPEIN
jgi:hypothetical protein